MKLLLTSAGVKNSSIDDELVDLLGKPITESSALIIPTAIYAFRGGAGVAWEIINGRASTPLCELGWKSLGVLELTALPSIDEDNWVPMVKETDALLVGGGDPLYLCYWMRRSGLADLFASLRATVYLGVSGGSLVMSPNVGDAFVFGEPSIDGDKALGLVDFSMFPHLDHEDMPEHSMANAENGPRACRFRATRLTIRPPSKWSTATSKWSPRGVGSYLLPNTDRHIGFTCDVWS
jgi:dipeptidase E